MKEAGAAADSPEPDVSDEAAAGANNDPVEAEEAPGSGIRSYNAGLGGEPSVHEAEVEADLDAARLVEGPEARHVGTLEPDHRSFSGEPRTPNPQTCRERVGPLRNAGVPKTSSPPSRRRSAPPARSPSRPPALPQRVERRRVHGGVPDGPSGAMLR